MSRLLQRLPFSVDGDAEAKGMRKGDVRSDCGGLVVVLQLLVARDLFVMDVAHMVALLCCHVVLRCCVVPVR